MNQKIMIEKFKIIFTVILLFVILLIIEGLFIIEESNWSIQNTINTPINLIRYFPIVILLYFLITDFFSLINTNDSLLKFSVPKKGIAYIQDFNLWLAVSKTSSTKKIQTNELKQLRHLKVFSLELDNEKGCIRIFLFSKSLNELEIQIINSKPILEAVLPDIELLSKLEIKELLNETELVKIGKNSFLREGSGLVIPIFFRFIDNFHSSFSRMIMSCKFQKEIGNEENSFEKGETQCYLILKDNQESFFKYINKIFFNSRDNVKENLYNVQELQKIRLRYQIERKPKHIFKEGLIHFKKRLSFLSTEPIQAMIKEKIKLPTLFSSNYKEMPIFQVSSEKPLLPPEKPLESFEMNLICSELCNIPRTCDLSRKDKNFKCDQRIKLSYKLLTENKITSVLKMIVDQKHEVDKSQCINELKNKLGYQQLVCILAQLTQSSKYKISFEMIIDILHVLFRLNYELQEASDVSKKPITSIINNTKTINQILPSLVQD